MLKNYNNENKEIKEKNKEEKSATIKDNISEKKP